MQRLNDAMSGLTRRSSRDRRKVLSYLTFAEEMPQGPVRDYHYEMGEALALALLARGKRVEGRWFL